MKDSERRPVPYQGSVKEKEAASLRLLLQTSWGFPDGYWWRMVRRHSFWDGESEGLHVSVSKLTTNIQWIVAVVVKLLSRVRLFVTPWNRTTGFPVLHCLPELAQTHVHWVGDAVQPSYPLCPFLLLPSIFPQIKVFSSESALHIRWPKYWSFNFSISFSNDYSGLISFRIDWLISLQSKGLSRVFSNTTIREH